MSDSKRKLNETEDIDSKQIKLEVIDEDDENKRNDFDNQDPSVIQLLKLKSILERVIQSEISLAKEDLDTIEDRIFHTRLCLIKVRQGVVSDYYRQSNKGKLQRPLHPAVQKIIGGKKPLRRIGNKSPSFESDSGSASDKGYSGFNYFESVAGPSGTSSNDSPNVIKIENFEDEEEVDIMDVDVKEEIKDSECVSVSDSETVIKSEPVDNDSDSTQVPGTIKQTKVPRYIPPKMSSLPVSKFNEPRGNISKHKVRIIIGNVSKWLGNDGLNASHKWTVYIKSADGSDLNKIISKVKYFLHPSYKPNDVVQISNAPFKLSRRGWGEFPLRVQFHFVNVNDKPVDVVHNLKLDRSYTGMETFGCETVIDIWLNNSGSDNHLLNEKDKNNLKPSIDFDSPCKEKSSETGDFEWINPIDSFIEEFDFNYLNKSSEDALKSFTDISTSLDKENKSGLENKEFNGSTNRKNIENIDSSLPNENILTGANSDKIKKTNIDHFNYCPSENENVDPNNRFSSSYNGQLMSSFSVQEHNPDWTTISPSGEVLSKEVCDKIESSLSTEDISSLSREALKNNPLLRQEVNDINPVEIDKVELSNDHFVNFVNPTDEAEEVLGDYQVEVVLESEDVDVPQSVEYCETEITIDENGDSYNDATVSSHSAIESVSGSSSNINSSTMDKSEDNNPILTYMNSSKDTLSNAKLINFNYRPTLLKTSSVDQSILSSNNIVLNKTALQFNNQVNTTKQNEKFIILPQKSVFLSKNNPNIFGGQAGKVAESLKSQGVFVVNSLKIQKEDNSLGIIKSFNQNQLNSISSPGRSMKGEKIKVSDEIKQNQSTRRNKKLIPGSQIKPHKLKACTGAVSLAPAPQLKSNMKKNVAFVNKKTQNCVKLMCIPGGDSFEKKFIVSSKVPQIQSSSSVKTPGKIVIVKKQDLSSNKTMNSDISKCPAPLIPQNDYGSCPRDSVENAVRWLLEIHPLVDPLAVNDQFRTVHPYCAQSVETFLSWPIAKQRAAEWLRAKTIARLLPKLCPHLKSWKMLDIVRYARFRAHTPLPAYKGPARKVNILVPKDFTVYNVENIVKKSREKNSLKEIDIVNLDSPTGPKCSVADDSSSDDEYEDSGGGMVSWVSRIINNISVGGSLALVSAFRSLSDDILRRSYEQSWIRHNYKKPSDLEKRDVLRSLLSREEFDLFTNDGLGKEEMPQVLHPSVKSKDPEVISSSACGESKKKS